MFDALALGMIPITLTQQPYTFRFLLDTPHGFTVQDLTLDIPDLPFDLEVMTRFVSALWPATLGSALSSEVHCSIATIVNWKGVGGITMIAPLSSGTGGQHIAGAGQKDAGVVVMHTGHVDTFARRRMYLPSIPRNWVHEGLLNGTGQTEIMNQWFRMYMAFKGGELQNPYRWLIAYPRVVASDETNLFGVAFRQPEFFRVCSHTGKPPEGAGLDWP